MGCCSDLISGFAKYILFLFNLLILVAAAIFIAMAVKLRENDHGYDMSRVSIFAIALGVFIAIIAFFGCCGAVRESSCMLSTYATVLIIFFIIQLVLGIVAFIAIKKNPDNHNVDDAINKYLHDLYEKSSKGDKSAQDVINGLQKGFECCGYLPNDDIYVKNATGTGLIASCCPDVHTGQQCVRAQAYHETCPIKLTDNFASITKAIGVVAIIFAAIELVAAIFACYVKNTST